MGNCASKVKTCIPIGIHLGANSYLKYQFDKVLRVGIRVKYFEKKKTALADNYSQKKYEDNLFSNFS
jgi:hypothetical protein